MSTNIVLRIWKNAPIALFSNELADSNPCLNCQSYQLIGQHGAANYEMIFKDSKPLDPNSEMGKDFINHLEKVIGYDDLKIIKSPRVQTGFNARAKQYRAMIEERQTSKAKGVI